MAATVGSEGSAIILHDLVRTKLVCSPVNEALATARTYSAPPSWPPNTVSVAPRTCVIGPGGVVTCFDNGLLFANFSFVVQSSDPETGAKHAGYTLHMANVTRVCHHYVTSECIKASGQDACIAQLVFQLQDHAPADVPPARGRALAPGEAAGVSVAGALLQMQCISTRPDTTRVHEH